MLDDKYQKYIDDCLDQGYSIQNIKKVLIDGNYANERDIDMYLDSVPNPPTVKTSLVSKSEMNKTTLPSEKYDGGNHPIHYRSMGIHVILNLIPVVNVIYLFIWISSTCKELYSNTNVRPHGNYLAYGLIMYPFGILSIVIGLPLSLVSSIGLILNLIGGALSMGTIILVIMFLYNYAKSLKELTGFKKRWTMILWFIPLAFPIKIQMLLNEKATDKK